MKRRPLGATGLELPVLGFGGSSLGGAFGAVDEEEAIRAVRAALDLGVDYFDVSPFYGRAESLLGRALRGVSRDRFVLSTKVGRYGERELDFSAARTRASVGESLERLGVRRLDIVLAHDVELGDRTQILEETLPTLGALVREGVVGAVGVSGLPLATLQSFLDAAPLDVVLSYGHYHLFDTSCDALRLGHAGLIAASPLAMGLLTPDGPPAWHPASSFIRDACARAASHAEARGMDLARVALSFALGNGRAASTLIGMRTVAEVEANVTTALGPPPDQAQLDALAPFYRVIQGGSWDAPR